MRPAFPPSEQPLPLRPFEHPSLASRVVFPTHPVFLVLALGRFVSILEERRREHVRRLADALAPSEERRRPETSACIKAVVEDIVKMHKTLQPLLTRHQLAQVFAQVLASFDSGLLSSYQALDSTPVFTRQCIVQDVHFVRTEVDKLHLVQNVFPELVRFAQALTLHQ